MKVFLYFVVFMGLYHLANAQEMYPVWTKTIGGFEWDMANATCVSPSGIIYAVGTYESSIDVEDRHFESKGFADIFVAKYDFAGNLVGAFSIGGTGYDFAKFAYSGKSFLVLAGYNGTFAAGNKKINSKGLVNNILCWFDDNDSLINNNVISSSEELSITSMNTNTDGSVYLIGSYKGSLQIDGKVYPVANNKTPLFILFTQDGKTHSLIPTVGLADKQINDCSLQSNDGMLITGITTGAGYEDPNDPFIILQSLYMATMNSRGVVSDVKELVKGVELQPVSIVKAKGCTWIAARFKYYCIDGSRRLNARGISDILLVKIPENNDKIQLWTIGGFGDDIPLSLKTSGDQVILTGSFSDTLWFSQNEYLVAGLMGSDVFIAVFEDTEIPVKTFSMGGLHNDFPCALATSEAGVYVVGQYRDTVDVANEEFITKGSYDVFISRFENCGAKYPIEISAVKIFDENKNLKYRLSIGDGYTNCVWSEGLGYSTTVTIDSLKTYWVEATSYFGCESRGEIDLLKFFNDTTSVGAILSDAGIKFALYPTVTDERIYWVPGSKFPESGATLKVFDLRGRTMLTKEYPLQLLPQAVQSLDLGCLKSGQYFVNLSGKGYNESVNIIVK